MVGRSVLLVAAVVLFCSDGSGACSYWCKKPNGAVYCCGPKRQYPEPIEHPGQCPKIRDACPTAVRFGPEVCPHDAVCPYDQKCCYDTCLEHHVCKFAVSDFPPIDVTIGPVRPPFPPSVTGTPIGPDTIPIEYVRNKNKRPQSGK